MVLEGILVDFPLSSLPSVLIILTALLTPPHHDRPRPPSTALSATSAATATVSAVSAAAVPLARSALSHTLRALGSGARIGRGFIRVRTTPFIVTATPVSPRRGWVRYRPGTRILIAATTVPGWAAGRDAEQRKKTPWGRGRAVPFVSFSLFFLLVSHHYFAARRLVLYYGEDGHGEDYGSNHFRFQPFANG
ncbi:hypothetical protein C8J57DRAFT_1507209 [Mycena rebaudengoi]|nr:hypothetical protein C8J57DRAFT_1507209 [Mycena rebaudengoi]